MTMDSHNEEIATASPSYSLSRLLSKSLNIVARRLPLIPGRWRVKLQSYRGVVFSDATSVFIGEDVYFDDIYPQYIFVGKNVIITSGTRILAHFLDTQFAPQPGRPFRFYHDNVRIEDDVFIGMNVVISKGCTIGKGAVIGAGSVVTKDIPANAIAGGVPARIIRYKPQNS